MHTTEWKNQFLLLQINDSLFPIGGYSHSYGLETYIQRGLVHDTSTAEEYLRNRLRYGFLYTDLLAVRLAYDAARKEDLEKINGLEEILEASRIPCELREASKKLGNRFQKTLLCMEPELRMGFFGRYLSMRRAGTTSHPCVYGVFCACAGIGRRDALAAFLYAQASASVTNCVKAIPLSQSAGQKLLYSLFPLFEEILQLVLTAGEEMLCASAPGFDLRSIQHEQLYSRLYMS
mgnify:CR=1 FL=1